LTFKRKSLIYNYENQTRNHSGLTEKGKEHVDLLIEEWDDKD